MVYIYVLLLEQNKYYIGKTTNPSFRLEQHVNSSGSSWTKKYKPVQIHELKPEQTDHDEQRITQEYMKKYGIDNVRGGPWCKININTTEKECIQKILYSEQDKCYQCGSNDHFASACHIKKSNKSTSNKSTSNKSTSNKSKVNSYNNLNSKTNIWNCKYCNKEFGSEKGCRFHENVHCKKKKNNCERCGRPGHYASTCYAKKDINSDIIIDESSEEESWVCKYCNKEFDSEKGCRFHENIHCKKKNKKKK